MDLKDYRELVKSLASERTGGTVFNGSADHAAIIVENLFASAESNIRIVTGDLTALVYGSEHVVQRAKQFLGHSDHTMEIIFENINVRKSHPLIEVIGENEKVVFRQLKADVSSQMGYHFMTADDDCFRFEKEKNSHAAIASFGDKATTTHLNELFGSLWGLSDPFAINSLEA